MPTPHVTTPARPPHRLAPRLSPPPRRVVGSAWALTLAGLLALYARQAAGGIDDVSPEPLPSELPAAAEVLRRVRDNLPREPLVIKGEVQSGYQREDREHAFYVEINVRWGETPPTASYLLRDHFGSPTDRLTVRHLPSGATLRDYQHGNPLQDAPVPDPVQPIRDTTVTWNDVTLDFLWWTNGVTVGREPSRGRDCLVIDMVSPLPAAGAPATGRPRPVRLWVDERLYVLLQMESRDDAGKPERRMLVKNFKKIGGWWIVKNLEVISLKSGLRTLVRIDSVTGPDTGTNTATGASETFPP